MALPAFLLPAFGGALITFAGSVVGRVLIALGMQVVVFAGMTAAFEFFYDLVISNVTGMGATAMQVFGLLRIDQCVAVLVGAAAAKYLLSGVLNGGMSRLLMKGPP